MSEFQTQRTCRGVRRYRGLLIALVVVLVGGAGFAATGGTEFVKKFITVRLIQVSGDDGQVTLDMTLEPAEDGRATGTARLGSVDGKNATISVEHQPLEETETAQQQTQITVRMEAVDGPEGVAEEESATATLELKATSPTDPSADNDTIHTVIIRDATDDAKAVTLEPLDENAMIWDWVDDNGLDRELRLIPDKPETEATAYTVLTAIETDNQMKAYQVIGSFPFEGIVADVLGIVENTDGSWTLQIIGEDGIRQTVELAAKRDDAQSRMLRNLVRQRAGDVTPE